MSAEPLEQDLQARPDTVVPENTISIAENVTTVDFMREKQIPPKKGIALALGGGAARGWAHIGVMRAIDEAKIPVSMIAGTSIGALVGGCYLAGKLDELEEFARSITRRNLLRYIDFSFRSSGLIIGKRLADKMDEHIGHLEIEDLDRRFIAIATDIKSGAEIWLNSGSLSQGIRASYALPGVFQPVEHFNRLMVDGALVNPVPISACRAYEARVVVAVHLDRYTAGRCAVVRSSSMDIHKLEAAEGEIPSEEAASSWLPFGLGNIAVASEKTSRLGITGIMIESFNIIQDRIVRSRMAGDPPDYIMRPRVGDIGLSDFHRANESIEHGYQEAIRQIEVLEQTGFRELIA
jgi:NTE family protein